MRRVRAFLTTRFGVAVLACLLVAGWAVWSAGIFAGPIANQVRVAATWIAPSFGVYAGDADRIVGNRRLVVIIRDDNSVPAREVCSDVEDAAAGTVALILTADGDRLRSYGCQQLFDTDDDLGRAAVIESVIGQGMDEFAERPLDALKVAAVNYDLLVTMDRIPQGARVISPSLPRYLVAAAAVGAVVLGSFGIWIASRRAGRLTAQRRADLEDHRDARSLLSAYLTAIAQQIIDLDAHHAAIRSAIRRTPSPLPAPRRDRRKKAARGGDLTQRNRTFDRDYLDLVGDFTDLMADVTAGDAVTDTDTDANAGTGADTDAARDESIPDLADRAEHLDRRARRLAEHAAMRTH